MTTEQYFKNLQTPMGSVDVILDTDAYNEVDDQYAIAYLLKQKNRLNVKALCAAPFLNSLSASAADGMEKSYQEILKLLKLMDREDMSEFVFKGSTGFLPDEQTPVESDAARYMATVADAYSPEKPLYIVAIGAITNVASAMLMNPGMKENVVVVWLGGNAHEWNTNAEFNLFQDVAAARIIFGCGVPLVQLPCFGVVDRFATSRYELEHWLKGRNALCDYLVDYTTATAESYAAGKPWTRVIWDVTAVAWLLNDDQRFMEDELRHSPIPEYDHHYAFDNSRHFIRYVTNIKRDRLFEALFNVLGE